MRSRDLIELRLQRGQLLPSAPARMTVQATQVGVLGMIIFACALGVFLIASAALLRIAAESTGNRR